MYFCIFRRSTVSARAPELRDRRSFHCTSLCIVCLLDHVDICYSFSIIKIELCACNFELHFSWRLLSSFFYELQYSFEGRIPSPVFLAGQSRLSWAPDESWDSFPGILGENSGQLLRGALGSCLASGQEGYRARKQFCAAFCISPCIIFSA